jgi:small subunit ribosomal protein S2
MSEMLISQEIYMANGIHIGMKSTSKNMKKFVFKIRGDGVAVLDLNKTDERIKIAAKFLARKQKILVVGRKLIAHKPIQKFAEIIEGKAMPGRYLPGTLTNPNLEEFYEADVLLVSDPLTDKQAMEDASKARIPIVAFCDSGDETRDVDLIIPANNKGKKAIAFLYWLLAREILKERGKIKKDEDYKYDVKDFL